MTATNTTQMPVPVRTYFQAMNHHDGAGMLAVFTPDALVNDIQREFWGTESISRWADREIIGVNVKTTTFVDTREHHGDFVVSAEVDGDYDKTGLPDPLVLTFYFSLAGERVSSLIILGNKPGY